MPSSVTRATNGASSSAGTLQVRIGFDEYVLEPGDAISLDSTIPHRLANVGDGSPSRRSGSSRPRSVGYASAVGRARGGARLSAAPIARTSATAVATRPGDAKHRVSRGHSPERSYGRLAPLCSTSCRERRLERSYRRLADLRYEPVANITGAVVPAPRPGRGTFVSRTSARAVSTTGSSPASRGRSTGGVAGSGLGRGLQCPGWRSRRMARPPVAAAATRPLPRRGRRPPLAAVAAALTVSRVVRVALASQM